MTEQQSGTGVNIPWWIFSIATAIIVWVLTYFGIRLSTRTTAILGGIEILIMLALGVTFLVHPGACSVASAPLQPWSAPTGWGGVLGGMVFSILALSGFEAPAPLAEETRVVKAPMPPSRFPLAAYRGNLLHFHGLCQRHWLGHGEHGSICHGQQ